jgi:hypothetical protein
VSIEGRMELAQLVPSYCEEDAYSSQILKFVERGLDAYGPMTKRVVYWQLWIRFKLTKKDIPSHPEKFVQSIRDVFGDSSSSIEQVIIREMITSSELQGVDSSDLITALKQASGY